MAGNSLFPVPADVIAPIGATLPVGRRRRGLMDGGRRRLGLKKLLRGVAEQGVGDQARGNTEKKNGKVTDQLDQGRRMGLISEDGGRD